MENTKEKGLLLTWKPEVSVWDYEKVYSEIQNGKKVKTTGWRTRAIQEVKIGMEVFIMKLGEKPKGIIAHGHVVKGPYLENETYYVDIEFDSIQNVDDEKNIISLAELKNKFKDKKWDSQGDAIGSYIDETILPELRKMWNKLINEEENSKTSDGGDEKETMGKASKKEFDKNVIFYGPPGTGKTYTTAKRAVEICKTESEKELTDYTEIMKKYNELKEKNRIEFITFHQSYGYEEFIEGIKPVVSNEDDESDSENSQEIKYEIVDGIFKKFCDEARKAQDKENNEYVFIIDEINRGNISKIFGELITLIETTKRAGKKECISTKLPYSKEEFTVPDNVYIIGTMNTADRSIALMDTALRRRFYFEEMLPNYDLLKDIFVEDEGVKVNIGAMLKAINERIEYLYDREHTIGHAVFLELNENNDIDKLENIFKKSVIPLLQEYFYEDYDKIRLILGDNAKDEDEQFIFAESIKPKDVFEGDIGDIDIPEKKYIIKYENFRNIMAYKNISKKLSDE
ncbi:McrB family protein [Fusobacterium polymorphum]|uniref:McrB family protein n=1 Tax=Fusobacterium nucleatum subsp. polymorphum TaxID=76857 RepID=UPI00300B6B6E